MVDAGQSSPDLSFTFSKSEFPSRNWAFPGQHELKQLTGVTVPRKASTFGLPTLVLCLLGQKSSWRQGKAPMDEQLLPLLGGGAWSLPSA